MFKSICVTIIFMLQTSSSFALLDFVADRADDLAAVAAYADATEELINEIQPDSKSKMDLKNLQQSARNLKILADEVLYLDKLTKDFLKQGVGSNEDVLNSIRHTTRLIRSAKSIITKFTVLGTKGILALNQMKTNLGVHQLNETNRALLIEIRRQNLYRLEKETLEKKNWQDFMENEKKLRREKKAI